MTCQAYLKKFQNSVEVIEHCGGDLSIDTGLIDATFATANPAVSRDAAAPQTLKAAQKYATEQYLAFAFLLGSGRKQYGKKKHRVTYDRAASKAFVVHKSDGSERRFEQAKSGLFYMDAEQNSGTVLVNTVEENKYKYTEHDYQRVLAARRLQNTTIGHKLTRAFLHIVKDNLLKNCPVTTEDIMAAEDILGTNVQSLRGNRYATAENTLRSNDRTCRA